MSMYSFEVQGLSLNAAAIRFEPEKQKSLNQGQMYATLIRVTNITNSYLIREYNVDAI